MRWLIEPNLERRVSSALEALKALDRPEIPSSSDLAISKPPGSKIQLTKNQDVLEIIIPPIGWQSSMLFLGSFAIAWNSFILFWTIGALSAPFPINLPFALFSLPFWGAGGFMMYGFLFTVWGRIRLRLDQQQVALTYELFGFKFRRPRPSPRQNITKLVYIPQHFTKDSDGERTRVPAQLELWAGVEKYQIEGSTNAIKSEAEREWLAHELSDWLGIEITRQ